MRVTKNSEGKFFVEDEPMSLSGPAAETFLRNMDKVDAGGDDTQRRQFLEECDRAYKSSVAKRVTK